MIGNIVNQFINGSSSGGSILSGSFLVPQIYSNSTYSIDLGVQINSLIFISTSNGSPSSTIWLGSIIFYNVLNDFGNWFTSTTKWKMLRSASTSSNVISISESDADSFSINPNGSYSSIKTTINGSNIIFTTTSSSIYPFIILYFLLN